MKLRRLTRKTCPRTGGQWYTCSHAPWAKLHLLPEGCNSIEPAWKARLTKERRRRARLSELPEPTPRMALADPERLALKARVLRAAGYRCQSCRYSRRLTVDHIVPRALGGGNHYENLQCLCEDCNQAKGLAIWAPEHRHAA